MNSDCVGIKVRFYCFCCYCVSFSCPLLCCVFALQKKNEKCKEKVSKVMGSASVLFSLKTYKNVEKK